ncbi:disease resistance protein RPM1 [Vigna unguiculata]|uniref:Disease resistance protein RPM1 n=1 Tax=Vigna unguiculata TaxID=3917 RepID=A0A4D6M6U4_VIGUN|nr:disease resistance protein RPM1 [Vigna unguiculata]
MAESFLFSIAESLIAKLASRAFEEASRVVGLYDDLQDLTNTLSLVKAVLLDAQQKQEHNHQLRQWLTQLKTVFSDAEDLLDEFECQTLRKKVVKAHGSTKDKVSHFFSSSNPLVFRYQMAQRIKDISNRLDKVATNRNKFTLERIEVDTRVVHRRDMTHSRVRGLSEGDSLSLLVKWAFKEGEEEKHPHLVDIIGREIVRKCGGVPLAVRTLGSLLFSKFEASEWEYVRDNEVWNLPQKKDDILPALKLSYDLMPSYLRQCFALFSLYPKDHLFISDEITCLWGALGLIALPKTNRTREDVGNQYLHELLSRSFLQDFQNYGTMYGFRIHDLVHDLALFVAKDECQRMNSNVQNISDNVRHLSFAESSLFSNLVTKKSAAVRTILFPNGVAAANCEAILKTCLEKFKCLRVLVLSGATFETLPRNIAKLRHLRYLDISDNPNIKRLPDSICKLQSLQVLLVNGCIELEALPNRLRKLISLQDFFFSTKQTVFPVNEIAKLRSLELLTVESCHNVESIFGGVKFPALKTLCVSDCQSLKSLWLDGQNFPKLETLFVDNCINLDLELWNGHDEEESAKLKLKLVSFYGLSQLVALPRWLQEVANSLQSLLVLDCPNIETLPDWLPTLTNLKALTIRNCPKLVSLPDSIRHLSTLENLRIEDCAHLSEKYELHVGQFWPNISHIKNVFIDEPEA